MGFATSPEIKGEFFYEAGPNGGPRLRDFCHLMSTNLSKLWPDLSLNSALCHVALSRPLCCDMMEEGSSQKSDGRTVVE